MKKRVKMETLLGAGRQDPSMIPRTPMWTVNTMVGRKEEKGVAGWVGSQASSPFPEFEGTGKSLDRSSPAMNRQ